MTSTLKLGGTAVPAVFIVPFLLMTACGPTEPASGTTAVNPERGSVVLAAPGRVEGLTEVVEVGAAMDGVLAEVPVQEGDRVEAGDLLARLVCDDREADLAAARAEKEAVVQARIRLLRGSRDEERRVAAADTAAARSVQERARQRYQRLARLKKDGSIVSDEDLDEAQRDLAVAEASLDAARESERLVNAPPLPEEVARADADVSAAANRVRLAEAWVEKCRIAAPREGTILRRHLQAGEQVSLALPRPIVSLADTSRLRVRAEVDERDVGRVRPGQPVLIEADALGDERLDGRVTRIGAMMGRKKVRTGDPAEKSDRDVLEVWIDLDQNDPRLVIDLRVTALFVDG